MTTTSDIPNLFDDNGSGHDYYDRKGSFIVFLEKFQDKSFGKINLVPTLSNFHRMADLARFGLSLFGKDIPNTIQNFLPQNQTSLLLGFQEYLGAIRTQLSNTSLSVSDPKHELTDTLTILDKNSSSISKGDVLRLLGVLSDGCFAGPNTFHMDISNLCNTNCIFCGLHSPLLKPAAPGSMGRRFVEGWKTSQISWEEFTSILSDLQELRHVSDLLLTGEGEPLTHPRIKEMIRVACSASIPVTLFTNGLLFDDDWINFILDAVPSILYWSLSASTENTFLKLQPSQQKGIFPKMVNAFSELCSRKGKSRPYVICAHVINNENAHEVESIFDLAVKTGVNAVRYQIMHACSSTDILLPNPNQIDELIKTLERIKAKARNKGIDIVANIDYQLHQAKYALNNDAPVFHWSRNLFEQTGCLVGWYFARCFSDGRLSFCCHDKIIGNLKRGSFRSTFQSEKYRRIRQAAKAFAPDKMNPDLTDDCCGSTLIDSECSFCGNYEFMVSAQNDLQRLELIKYLKREPLLWP